MAMPLCQRIVSRLLVALLIEVVAFLAVWAWGSVGKSGEDTHVKASLEYTIFDASGEGTPGAVELYRRSLPIGLLA